MLCGLLVYATVLALGVPTPVAFDGRIGAYCLLAVPIVMFPAFSHRGWLGVTVGLSAAFALFALPLLGMWQTASSDSFTVGGLLPWSDASSYYSDAERLMAGGTVSALPARPLFAGTLAVLLRLTRDNLQATLAILVAVTALSCFAAAWEVRRSHGVAAALVVLMLLFLFYRRFAGTTMTEHLGLALGAAAFALLWRVANQDRSTLQQSTEIALGMFLLTLALCARAGAFLVLPALIAWPAVAGGSVLRFRIPVTAAACAAVAGGFLANGIVSKVIAAPSGVAFGNFSLVLYGLSVGSNWSQVFIDHPALRGVPEYDLFRSAYELARQAILAHPLVFVSSLVRAWAQFLASGYPFVFTGSYELGRFLCGLGLVGLWSCRSRPVTRRAYLVGCALAGIVLSVPFVPPWDADVMRAYAATLPFLAVLPGLGIAYVARKLSRRSGPPVLAGDVMDLPLVLYGGVLGIVCLVGPLVIKATSQRSIPKPVECSQGLAPVYVRLARESILNVYADRSLDRTRLPNARSSDLKNRLVALRIFGYAELADELDRIDPPASVAFTIDLSTLEPLWLIAQGTQLAADNHAVAVCGTRAMDQYLEHYGFFYAARLEHSERGPVLVVK